MIRKKTTIIVYSVTDERGRYMGPGAALMRRMAAIYPAHWASRRSKSYARRGDGHRPLRLLECRMEDVWLAEVAGS